MLFAAAAMPLRRYADTHGGFTPFKIALDAAAIDCHDGRCFFFFSILRYAFDSIRCCAIAASHYL